MRWFGARVRTRMAILKLSGDRLLVYSPVFLSSHLRREVEELGEVSFVVAPNKLHNQALLQWERAFPAATFCLPPGLRERRPGLRCDVVLGAGPLSEWRDEVDQALIGGNCFFSEVVLLHRGSRTLLVADLVENVGHDRTPTFARWLTRPFGAAERAEPSPEFRLYTLDAEAARESLARVRRWPVELVFLCHGGILRDHAKEVFDAMCEELLASSARRGPLARKLLGRLAHLQ